MKRNIIFIVAAFLTLFLSASCGRQCEYERISYLTLYNTAYDVREDIGQLNIPVLINNASGAEVQVAVKVEGETAEEGVHYEVVSPANGILTFSGDTDSLAVVIDITEDFIAEFILDKNFFVTVESMTDGLYTGAFTQAEVNIVDIDHPLFPFMGTWKGQLESYYGNGTYDVNFKVKSAKNDDTYSKLVVDAGINPYFVLNGYNKATYEAVVSGDYMTVLADQPCGYSDVVLLGFNHVNPEAADSNSDLVYELQEDGTLLLKTAYGAYTPSGRGYYELYLGGSIFTRQE